MVSIVTKNIKGKEYLYLVDSVRQGDKVKQKTIKYIGKKRPIPQEEFHCMKLSLSNGDWILREVRDYLSYQDHEQLNQASTNQKKYLKSLDPISKEKEQEKLLSRFIASSNAIEGSTLSAKETFDFLFNDVVPTQHSKKELFMANNLFDAWKYLKKHYRKFPTHEDIWELHRRVNRGVESEKTLGNYKPTQNHIGDIHTSSFLFVDEKMEQLLSWIRKAYRHVNNFEVAFQSHAQFEIIHPFVDGNGRVGRLLMNWLLMYKQLEPFTIDEKKRNDYIIALDNSRKGAVEAISRFCCTQYLENYRFV